MSLAQLEQFQEEFMKQQYLRYLQKMKSKCKQDMTASQSTPVAEEVVSKKRGRKTKQSASSENEAVKVVAVAAPPSTPVAEEAAAVSKIRGRKPKASVSPEEADARRLIIESIRP